MAYFNDLPVKVMKLMTNMQFLTEIGPRAGKLRSDPLIGRYVPFYLRKCRIYYSGLSMRVGRKRFSTQTVSELQSSGRPLPVFSPQEKRALVTLSRPSNIIPSFLIVLAGAWMAHGKNVHVLKNANVLAAGLASALISVASCIVNDFFDYEVGTDVINNPEKPLPAGMIPPDHVIGAGLGCYVLVLLMTALLQDFRLRFVLAVSTVLTLAYTPVFKRLGLLKNVVVGGVVASAPIAGALAVGTSTTDLWRVANLVGLVFLGTISREIIMDISDMHGDALVGLKTFPVIFGKNPSMMVAFMGLLGTMGIILFGVMRSSALTSSVSFWFGSSMTQISIKLGLICVIFYSFLFPSTTLINIWSSNFDAIFIDRYISQIRLLMAFGIVLLSLLN